MLSRRDLLWLGTAGALTAVVPTLRLAPAMAEDKKLPGDGNFPAGRIFLSANLNPKSKERNAYAGDVRRIIAVDPETGQWEEIAEGDDVRVSRDGKLLAMARYHDVVPRGNSTEIWTYDLAARRATRVVDDVEAHDAARIFDQGETALCWSPDGKQIVATRGHFTEDEQSRDATWRVPVDGSKPTKLPIPATDQVADWSADGKWLVAVTNRKPPFGHGYQLYRMRPDGSEQLRLTKDGLNYYPCFSPDSRRIVYLHQTAKDGNSLHMMDADGKNDREILREEGLVSVEGGCFSPDGRRLAVLRFNWHRNAKGEKVLEKPSEANWRSRNHGRRWRQPPRASLGQGQNRLAQPSRLAVSNVVFRKSGLTHPEERNVAMTTPYGPWATSIDAGGNPELQRLLAAAADDARGGQRDQSRALAARSALAGHGGRSDGRLADSPACPRDGRGKEGGRGGQQISYSQRRTKRNGKTV